MTCYSKRTKELSSDWKNYKSSFPNDSSCRDHGFAFQEHRKSQKVNLQEATS